QNVVVPYHPPAADNEAFTHLAARAVESGVAIERLCVLDEHSSFTMFDPTTGRTPKAVGRWTRDSFGRLTSAGLRLAPTSSDLRSLRVGLVGDERDNRDVYPATLAALGDAADAERIATEFVFIPPRDLREQDVDGSLEGVDGLILPGGSDMANVAGQI